MITLLIGALKTVSKGSEKESGRVGNQRTIETTALLRSARILRILNPGDMKTPVKDHQITLV